MSSVVESSDRFVTCAAYGMRRSRVLPNPFSDAVRQLEGCRLVFAFIGWSEFEATSNGRVLDEVRVRGLPSSCSVCAFGWRNEYNDDLPMFCSAAWMRMPNAMFDISKHRAPFCTLVEDSAARLDVVRCPAREKMNISRF